MSSLISNTAATASLQRGVRRVRHELKMRLLQVRRVEHVTPRLLRVTLAGDDLEGFTSAAFDDHVKVFFPAPGQDRPELPQLGPNGPAGPGGPDATDTPPTARRDYTPRRYDPASRELDIEFALHGHGPAAEWAAQARAGQYLGVGGPRGSMVMEGDFDGYLMVGDETALPAIARRLEELPAGARVCVVAQVADAKEEQTFRTLADLTVRWVHRGASDDAVTSNRAAPSGDAVVAALRDLRLPDGDIYAWVAAESSVAKAVRAYLVGERGLNKAWVKAAGYWRRGAEATHDKHED
ncbi:siderophore-interacting protein [Pigmentiphaga litoralis]|uniref:siderophore-interacting protein n=1 Tax=Pigmentiphaga litoralis TaxID=516702 RepID=UPI001675250B|nr:siderophore-interacting protein [Pigmentiphaga litoralis]GGX06182.1 siderophore-interacting protein [Pigmentiphaga litoralis]